MYKCKLCGEIVENITKHFKTKHPKEYEEIDAYARPEFMDWLMDAYPERISEIMQSMWDEYIEATDSDVEEVIFQKYMELQD